MSLYIYIYIYTHTKGITLRLRFWVLQFFFSYGFLVISWVFVQVYNTFLPLSPVLDFVFFYRSLCQFDIWVFLFFLYFGGFFDELWAGLSHLIFLLYYFAKKVKKFGLFSKLLLPFDLFAI